MDARPNQISLPPQNVEIEIILEPHSQPNSRDNSKNRKQRDRYKQQQRSREQSTARTDSESIVDRYQSNIQKEHYPGELGVTLITEDTDIPGN